MANSKKTMTISVRERDYDLVDGASKKYGISRSEITRRALVFALHKPDPKFIEILEEY
jgi:hypothetical protein